MHFCLSQLFTASTRFAYSAPPTLTPAATKKLIEKRNDGFVRAVNECVVESHARWHILRYNIGYSKPLRELKTLWNYYRRLLGNISLSTQIHLVKR